MGGPAHSRPPAQALACRIRSNRHLLDVGASVNDISQAPSTRAILVVNGHPETACLLVAQEAAESVARRRRMRRAAFSSACGEVTRVHVAVKARGCGLGARLLRALGVTARPPTSAKWTSSASIAAVATPAGLRTVEPTSTGCAGLPRFSQTLP